MHENSVLTVDDESRRMNSSYVGGSGIVYHRYLLEVKTLNTMWARYLEDD